MSEAVYALKRYMTALSFLYGSHICFQLQVSRVLCASHRTAMCSLVEQQVSSLASDMPPLDVLRTRITTASPLGIAFGAREPSNQLLEASVAKASENKSAFQVSAALVYEDAETVLNLQKGLQYHM